MTSKTPQKALLEQAKRGKTAAIASLMNRTLAKQESQVQIRKKDGHYKLLVVAAEVPPQKATVRWIAKGLQRLSIQDLAQATIYGKANASTQPDWKQHINFAAMASSPDTAIPADEGHQDYKDSESSAVNQSPKQASPQAPEDKVQSVISATEPSIDLTEYCFTRNKSLLKGDLTYPAESVAQLVLSFAALSDDQKQAALPHIEQALRKPVPIENEIGAEAKDWLAKIAELEGPQIRKASIWLSRYCLNPVTTVTQLDKSAIIAQQQEEAADDADAAEGAEVIEVDATSTNAPFPSTHNHSSVAVAPSSRHRSRRTEKPQREPTLFSQLDGKPPWMIPAIWSACLAVMIMLGVVSASNATYAFPICQQSTADASLCNLAVQIIGDELYMEDVIGKMGAAPAMTSASKSVSVENCRRFAIEMAGGFSSGAESAMPAVIASQSTEIFPGMLLTDVTQPSAIDGTPVRAACVDHAVPVGQEMWDEYAPFELADADIADDSMWPQPMGGDTIPTDWPEVPYDADLDADVSAAKALGIYNVFITFGADTLFTAIGMLIVVFMGLAFSCYTLQGVYKAAFVAGVAGSLLSFIPAFGLFAGIAKQVLAIGIASAVVPEFKIDWSCGYYYVAIATIIVGIVRTLLSWLLFGAIAAIVFG